MKGGGRVFVGAENCECLSGCPAPLVPGRYVTLSIRDEGGGIDPEYLHRIFDPFFTTKEQGSGLGLAISYSIIKKHGGHLIVNSEPGHGATFQIYLPATEKIPLPIATPAKNEFRGKGKLLVIDDKEYIRIVAQNMLVDMGFSVVTAADGESGLYHFRKATHDGAPFTGVILDLTIPGGKSGTEIARELNQIDPAARVIVSSGYSDDPVMASPSRYGFSGRLSKPYTFEEFGKVLEEVLRTRDG
jgi:CheY-like chemotaxis protein